VKWSELVLVVDSCTLHYLRKAVPIHLFRSIFCYRVYAQRHRQTDGQTDAIMMTIADHSACSTSG